MKDIQSVTVAGPALKEDSIECYTSIKKNSQANEMQQRGYQGLFLPTVPSSKIECE
jgi:hypothetical protein